MENAYTQIETNKATAIVYLRYCKAGWGIPR